MKKRKEKKKLGLGLPHLNKKTRKRNSVVIYLAIEYIENDITSLEISTLFGHFNQI